MRKTVQTDSNIPKVGEGKRGVDGHLGYLLRQAHNAHRARMEHALADDGVTVPQFSVLVMLAAYPGASGAELARLSLLTPQTMNVILANLERDGAIVRRPHGEHGRIQLNELTATGKALLARCKRAVKPAEAALVQGLAPDEEQVVRRWLVQAAQTAAQ
jgi:DNA-binding MarR family transcriptional regulator